MSHNLQPMTIKSPYRQGADDGFLLGIYLSAMSLCMVNSTRIPLLALMALGMFVAVPAIVYTFMRRYDRRLGRASGFAVNWMHGVMIFVCAALVSGAVMTVYMRWIDPGFIPSQMEILAGMEGRFPGSAFDQSAMLARQMVEANFMPSAISISVELIFLEIFSGSCLAMLLSGILALMRPKRFNSYDSYNS